MKEIIILPTIICGVGGLVMLFLSYIEDIPELRRKGRSESLLLLTIAIAELYIINHYTL